MATPCRLVGLGAAIICLTPRIKTVESLFSCPTRSCFGFNTCNHDSPVSSKPRPRCRRLGSLVRARSGSFTAVDNPTYGKEADGSTPRESREGRDGDGGEEQAASELGPTSAPQGIVRPKPAWVEDPSESRVKGWIRAAARRRDHERVVMYLHRYREGLARKEESVGIEVYNTVLRALEECERWKLALGVLRGMQTDRVAPDRNSYFFVISACSRRGEASTAVELVGEMQRGQAGGGPVPDLLLFSVAIKACAYGRRWQQAVRLLGDMESAGVQPNLVVVNTVLTACARCGQTLRATEILKRMKATHGIDPDARSYNSVINGHERAGEWREALSLAQIMERAEGVTPTVVTFNSVIGACKRAKKPTEALAVLGLMRRKGLKPDVISYNSAISACSSGGMWKPALQLLEIMPTEGVQPDLTTYNAALDVCAKSGQWEMALSLFEELSRSEDPVLVPDLYTYNTVMTVFSRSGMLRRGLELLERMKASGLSPDVVTYRLTGIALLSALSLSPSRGVASPTWRRAPETRGVLCARVELVDSTLVRACERALPPQPEVALRLVSEMDAEDVAPNNTTFVSVALSFGRAGRPLESLDVLETMRQRGSPPDAICCQTVLRVLDRWNKPAEALGLFEYMGHHGLLEVPEVTEAAYCCGIRALEKLGRWREAVSLLERWRKLDHASDNGSDPGKDAKYDQWYRALSILASGGLPPDTDVRTARAAMVAAASGGLAEEALAIMRNMEDIGFELGAVEYGAAMEAFEQSRKPERSLEIFDDMLANNVEPDVLCFASATRCLRVSGDWETAVRLVVTALSQGLLPNSRTFETLARLCSQSGRYRELWGVKDYMRDLVSQGGLARPGSSLYISLIRVCGAARRPDLVLRCLSEMSADQAPGKDWRTRALDDPSTLSAAIGALSACNRTAEADIIFNRAIEQGILPDATSGGTWAAAEARARAAQHTGADGKAAGESKGLDEDENTGEPDSKKVLWVDIRRAPVEIVSAIVRRAVRALRVVGSVSDGVVVEWGGGRWTEGDEWDALLDSSTGGDRGSRSAPSGRSASRAGRRDGVLEAFARIEPRLTVTEPKGCRGQVHVEKEELRRWLRESQKRRRRRRKEREG